MIRINITDHHELAILIIIEGKIFDHEGFDIVYI